MAKFCLLGAISRPVSSEESAGEFLVHLQVSENTCVPGRPSRRSQPAGAGKGGRRSVTPSSPELWRAGPCSQRRCLSPRGTSVLVPSLLCRCAL